MSTQLNKLPLEKARKWAERVLELLRPHCDRIEIAGSIRRQKPEIGDIEVVCIPTQVTDLVGATIEPCAGFIETVNKWEAVKGSPTGKYTQRILPNTGGFKLDIFIADPDNWGWILALRTGSDVFNQRVFIRGLRAKNLTSEDGHIYDYTDTLHPQLIPVKEEVDFFKLLGVEFVAPEARNMEAW